MAAVTTTRLRSGALLWLLTLQFFVVETVVQAQYELGYSRIDDTISLLGSSASPAQFLMNASFVVQGVLILGGLVLLRPLLVGRGVQVATAALATAAAGVVIVGLLPLGRSWHDFGAALYLIGTAIGLIGLAYAVRPRSEALGTTLALLGLVGFATTVFFAAGVTGLLGEGGTERAAAYPLPIGLALTGAALLRLGSRPLRRAAADGQDAAVDRRALREQERAERARRARERDEALEAAAARTAAERPARETAEEPAGAAPGDDADPDFDPDDPWATPRRRRDT